MNLQSLVVVLLRLISLNFLLQVLNQLTPQLMRFSEAYHSYRNLGGSGLGSLLVLPLLLIIAYCVGAALLWVFAMPMARFVTRGLAPELSLGTLTLADCYSFLFIGIGLFYAVANFAHVLNWAHYILHMAATHQDASWREDVKWHDASDAIIPFIVGLILFVSGRKWALALVRKEAKSAAPSAPAAAVEQSTPS